MLQRLARFVLYQVMPERTRAVRPASITYWSARGAASTAKARAGAGGRVRRALAGGELEVWHPIQDEQVVVDEKTWIDLDAAGSGGTGVRPPLRGLPASTASPEEVLSGPGTSLERRPAPSLALVPYADSRRAQRIWDRLPAPGRLASAGITVAAVAATAGLFYAPSFGGGGEDVTRKPRAASGPRPFVPQRHTPLAAQFPSEPRRAAHYPTARVGRNTVLRDSPGGRPRVRITGRTEWGSPRVLSVVRQHGGWLGVLVPELGNGEIAWLKADDGTVHAIPYALHTDLSRRRVTVRREGRVVRRIPVAIGARRTPTPTGRFAVTDKLRLRDPSSPYGCCVLALTGHQTRLPPDWPGGDRLALHSTRDVKRVGRATTLGCMRTDLRQARWLMKVIPPGTPVFIKR